MLWISTHQVIRDGSTKPVEKVGSVLARPPCGRYLFVADFWQFIPFMEVREQPGKTLQKRLLDTMIGSGGRIIENDRSRRSYALAYKSISGVVSRMMPPGLRHRYASRQRSPTNLSFKCSMVCELNIRSRLLSSIGHGPPLVKSNDKSACRDFE